jgi:hypothetical protein
MDAVKKAFADLTKKAVIKAIDDGMEDVLQEASDRDDAVVLEFQDIAPLLSRVRVSQGPGRGPRYFDVIVKESL